MNGELLFVLLILLLVFILFTFLGRKSLFEGLVNTTTMYYGDSGKTATVTSDGSGTTIVVTNPDGTTSKFVATSSSNTSFTGPNGSTATISTNNGINTLTIVDAYGNTIAVFTTQNTNTNIVDSSTNNYNQYDNYNHYYQNSYPVIFYGPNGSTARVIRTPNNNTIVVTTSNGTTQIYYISNQANVQEYYGPNGGSAKVVTMSNGQKAVEITMPNGQKMYYYTSNNIYNNAVDETINQYTGSGTGSDYNSAFTANSYFGGKVNTVTGPAGNTVATYDNSAYSNSLPNGIPKYMIPQGEEDLYILKSEVVPPVCPKCPEPVVNCSDFDVTKCPPCPPCARCPEPSFDCKKVPNYNAFNPDTMPVPVLSDFSQFGM